MFPAETGNEGSMTMEQSEFMTKLGLPCDDSLEVNQQVIIGDVMSLRDKIAQMHIKINELNGKINELNGEIHGLKGEASVMGLHERLLQERLDAVIEVVGDESLVERMVDDIETEDIIDAWIRSKNMKQNGRQVGQ